jgi:hypothetical protein
MEVQIGVHKQVNVLSISDTKKVICSFSSAGAGIQLRTLSTNHKRTKPLGHAAALITEFFWYSIKAMIAVSNMLCYKLGKSRQIFRFKDCSHFTPRYFKTLSLNSFVFFWIPLSLLISNTISTYVKVKSCFIKVFLVFYIRIIKSRHQNFV